MPRDARAIVFQLFREMVEPLRKAGKLGLILLQMAPYVVVKPRSLDYLEWARAQLDGYDVQVEFRHRAGSRTSIGRRRSRSSRRRGSGT